MYLKNSFSFLCGFVASTVDKEKLNLSPVSQKQNDAYDLCETMQLFQRGCFIGPDHTYY